MRAGLLTEHVTFQSPVVVETEFSGKKTEYRNFCTTRAAVRHLRGNKGVETGEIFTSFTVEFTVRYYHQVRPDMRILHDGQKYRILDINPLKKQQRKIITGEIINE